MTFDPQGKANKLVASALVIKGESLAQEGKLKETIETFKRAKELDASLTFDQNELLALTFALFNQGTTLYKQHKYEEAATIFAQCLKYFPENLDLLSNDAKLALVQNDLPRFQERLTKLLPRVEENKKLVVILPFFSWLADPKRDEKEVLAAIEQHPDLTVEWDFADLEPAIQRQEPSRQEIAQYFIDFWMKEIDLKTLKKQLGTK